MMNKKKIPIGIEDFKRLIDKGCYFVDKSLLIQYYFEKQKTDNSYLFEELKISQAGKEYQKYMEKYPVITLSFKGMKKDTYEEALKNFKWIMSQECQRHMEILQSGKVLDTEKKFQRLLNEEATVS